MISTPRSGSLILKPSIVAVQEASITGLRNDSWGDEERWGRRELTQQRWSWLAHSLWIEMEWPRSKSRSHLGAERRERRETVYLNRVLCFPIVSLESERERWWFIDIKDVHQLERRSWGGRERRERKEGELTRMASGEVATTRSVDGGEVANAEEVFMIARENEKWSLGSEECVWDNDRWEDRWIKWEWGE
jgi:hypothetical protein